MNDIILSDDALLVLSEIYHEYLEKDDLNLLDSTEFTKDHLQSLPGIDSMNNIKLSDILGYLKQHNLIKVDITDAGYITETGIAYMNNRFNKNKQKVKDIIKSLIIGHIT